MYNRFPDSDDHLSQLLKQDIRKGFEILYNQQFAVIYYFARGFVSDQQAAEDITSEAFLKLWLRLNDFANISAMRSFLYTVAKNACLNYLRDSRRHTAENEKMAYMLEQNDESSLEKENLNADIWQHIYNAIENLSPQLKNVFKMAYVEGLSNEKIARILGINNQSVRNDKARALKQVRLTLMDKKLNSLLILTGQISLIKIKTGLIFLVNFLN